jgi:multiple sugar transport system ATP-binding protein
MTGVEFQEVTRRYSKGAPPAVDALDLSIEEGEFMVLVGPSGCGKSTSLRLLAGLEPVDDGSIWLAGADITDVPTKLRDIAMVFQSYALYPHMTVRDNIGFHLRLAHVPRSERRAKVLEVAKLLELDDLLDRKPGQLSGGQRQRVAMGRAIVRRPAVFLMDEPLSNLDAKLRVQTRTMIASLQRRLRTTTIYVTHDQVEAMTMGDRVAVMKDGLLQQVGTPRELYAQPTNAFVAGFIGSPPMNVFAAGSLNGEPSIGDVAVPAAGSWPSRLLFGVRPEGWDVVAEGGLPVDVVAVEELGNESIVYCTSSGADGQIAVKRPGLHRAAVGTQWHLAPHPGAVHVFDADTGRALTHGV